MRKFWIVRRRVSLKGRRRHYLLHKERARELIETKVRYFSAMYGLEFNRIFVRNQKSRWGSCSKGGNLNFHYKLILLPEHVADYIIVHELCHLIHFDHSRAFWETVARTIPQHKAIRKELRDLTVFG
jgi:hypothetical protein